MSGHGKRIASVLALVLACSTFTGAAFADNGGGNGKSGEAPGQEKKAEESQQESTPPGQAKKEEQQAEQAPAATTETQTQQSSSPAKSAAPGQQKKAAKAEAKAQTNQETRASGPGVKPSNTTSKWTTCETGGGTGTSATCRGDHSPKADASKQYGNGKTAAQIANERGAPAGTVLTGPGNSQPHKVAVCPRKNNKSGGVDVHAVKSYSTAACEQQQQQPNVNVKVEESCPTVTTTTTTTQVVGVRHKNGKLMTNPKSAHFKGKHGDQPVLETTTQVVTTPTGRQCAEVQISGQPSPPTQPTQPTQPTAAVTPAAAPTAPAGGVAGAQVAIPQPPAAGQPAEAGGVLGALAQAGRGGELPFTGIPLWIAVLAAFALLGGGFAVRRATSS